jgi:hypothetical protein
MEAIEAETVRAKETKGWNDKGSEFNFSVSISQSGIHGAASSFDIVRVEKINKQVLGMIQSKTALESALAMIRACKEAFKSLSRATIFIIDPYLQAVIM